MAFDSPELELQAAIQERLQSIAALDAAGVAVFAEVADDTRTTTSFIPASKQVFEAMQTTGIAIEVTLTGATVTTSNNLLTVRPRVLIHENGATNDSGISANEALQLIRDSLLHWQPDTAWSDPREISNDVLEAADQTRLRIDWTQELCLSLTAKVADPAIAEAAGEVTLTCGTAGATIYYTTDGTYPSSVNGTTYSTPFTLTPGSYTVRASAEKSGLHNSDVTRAALTIT